MRSIFVAAAVLFVGCSGGGDAQDSTDGAQNPDGAIDGSSDVVAGDSANDTTPHPDAPKPDVPLDSPVDLGPPSARCAPLTLPATFTEVTDPTKLVQTVYDAKPGDTIVLPDGTYDIGAATLQLHAAGVTLRGKSGDRTKVILESAYDTTVGETIQISADDCTVAHLTIAHPYNHAVHAFGSATADVLRPRIYDVHVVDPGQQGIKVNADGARTHFVDDGVVACSRIELTDAGRPLIRDSCYTGGIDIHDARGWDIRDNVIVGFWCASGLSEHGIHLWTGSRDSIVERNVIQDCARGIGLGLGDTTVGRTYPDSPCGGATMVGHYGGVVRNNTVFAGSDALFASAASFDSGIDFEQACDVDVAHNTVFSTKPPVSSSIEWRFDKTSVRLFDNLVSDKLLDRGAGATATESGDVTPAAASLFVDPVGGDLHLKPPATGAKDAGKPVPAGVCDDDMDGEPRTDPRDVGADELP